MVLYRVADEKENERKNTTTTTAALMRPHVPVLIQAIQAHARQAIPWRAAPVAPRKDAEYSSNAWTPMQVPRPAMSPSGSRIGRWLCVWPWTRLPRQTQRSLMHQKFKLRTGRDQGRQPCQQQRCNRAQSNWARTMKGRHRNRVRAAGMPPAPRRGGRCTLLQRLRNLKHSGSITTRMSLRRAHYGSDDRVKSSGLKLTQPSQWSILPRIGKTGMASTAALATPVLCKATPRPAAMPRTTATMMAATHHRRKTRRKTRPSLTAPAQTVQTRRRPCMRVLAQPRRPTYWRIGCARARSCCRLFRATRRQPKRCRSVQLLLERC